MTFTEHDHREAQTRALVWFARALTGWSPPANPEPTRPPHAGSTTARKQMYQQSRAKRQAEALERKRRVGR